MGSKYHGHSAPSRLKLSLVPNKPPPRLKLGGMAPPDHMPAGQYRVHCEGASRELWKGSSRIVLNFRVLDGDFEGVALNGWITLKAAGVISPNSAYAKQCEIALGRPLDAEDDLNDPASIFCSAPVYLADVGFRKSDKPGGGTVRIDNEKSRKDVKDGLRVHALLSREEL